MTIDNATEGEIIARYLHKGKIAQIPVKQEPRLLVLEWLVKRIPLDQHFTETEINAYLGGHEVDHVTLRRLLVDYQFLSRDKGIYWRPSDTAPRRS